MAQLWMQGITPALDFELCHVTCSSQRHVGGGQCATSECQSEDALCVSPYSLAFCDHTRERSHPRQLLLFDPEFHDQQVKSRTVPIPSNLDELPQPTCKLMKNTYFMPLRYCVIQHY